ncbi:Uncharacterised protein [Mycobacterium tuberculosis]|nr:Uncharacterised protein [Mycobacterium tuberculosis]
MLGVVATMVSANLNEQTAVIVHISDASRTGAQANTRLIGNGGSVSAAAGQGIHYMAVGY